LKYSTEILNEIGDSKLTTEIINYKKQKIEKIGKLNKIIKQKTLKIFGYLNLLIKQGDYELVNDKNFINFAKSFEVFDKIYNEYSSSILLDETDVTLVSLKNDLIMGLDKIVYTIKPLLQDTSIVGYKTLVNINNELNELISNIETFNLK